ncbi:hypothetical protein P4V64_19420 [Bacillus thuringiensis]|nr:hypothetical protein [Bacillus thuringiensis]
MSRSRNESNPRTEYITRGDETDRTMTAGSGGSGESSRPDAADMDRITGGARPTGRRE